MQALAQLFSDLPVERVVARARLDILQHLGAALVAGGASGTERRFHGRPAGD